MNDRLDNLTVLVTGASRGIGREIAITLAAAGARLSLVARGKEALEEVGKLVAEQGAEAIAIPVDLAIHGAPEEAARQTAEHFGGIDVLINNAGSALSKSFEETTPEDWKHLMRLNAEVPYFLCKAVLPYLRRSAAASIVNISSVVGRKGYVGQSAYGASKHALVGFSKALAAELQGDDIRVHVVAPGATRTELIGSVRPDIDPAQMIAPAEIAEAVLFLLSHRNTAVIDELNLRRAGGTPWQ